MRRTPSRRLRGPSVAAATLVVSLAAAELAARAMYRPFLDLGEYQAWSAEVDPSFTPLPNRLGHREEEITPEILADGVTRVLFLGDSFTYGHALPDGSARFTDRIEASLDASGARVDLYNAAVSGSNPSDWKETLANLLPEYDPDFVVAVFFLRCGTKLATSFRAHEKVVRRFRHRYERHRLYRWSGLYRLWVEKRVAHEFSGYYTDLLESSYLGGEERTARWRSEQAALGEMRDLCRERGIELHLVIYPMLYRLDDYPFGPVEAEIARAAEELGIPVFSLTPAFLDRAAASLWIAPSDQHPNAEGHRIAAEALLPFVRALVGGAA